MTMYYAPPYLHPGLLLLIKENSPHFNLQEHLILIDVVYMVPVVVPNRQHFRQGFRLNLPNSQKVRTIMRECYIWQRAWKICVMAI